VLDGYPLTKQGKSGKALKMALYASVIGDLFSDFVLILVSVPIALVAMKFGSVEFAMLLLFSLTFTGALAGESMMKGVVSALLGLLLSTVGLDPITAEPRFSFGIFSLTSGFTFIVVLIGMFTVSEVLIQFEKYRKQKGVDPTKAEDAKRWAEAAKLRSQHKDDNRVTAHDMKISAKPIAVSTLIGTFLGAMPGLGGSIAAFVAYGTAKNLSKNKDKFGDGAIEGVAAPEAANNAVCGANLIPFLSLGIPGNSAAAILGAGLMMQGIRPGPTIFQEHGAIVYAIFAGMILANFAVLWFGWYFIKMARRGLDIPRGILFPLILILSVVGSYAIENSIFDVYTLIGFGFMGYVMRKYKFPTAPLVIAFLLGPLAERSFRQSLIISRGSYTVFFESPVALLFFCLMVFSILSIAYGQFKKMRQKNSG